VAAAAAVFDEGVPAMFVLRPGRRRRRPCLAASQRSKSAGVSTTTVSAMRACWVPQNSAQTPRCTPSVVGVTTRRFVRPGTRSILPPSAGTHRLCSTSSLVSPICTGRPAGSRSSLAATIQRPLAASW
jgi:hypothetical protein